MVITEFPVLNQQTKTQHTAHIRMLSKLDFPAYRQLDDEIIEDLNAPSVYQANTDEFAQNCIEEKTGFCTGCFVDNSLIAYAMTFFPLDSPKNMGLDVNLPQELFLKVAHLDSVGVKPDFRGNGIQQKCMRVNMDIMQRKHFQYMFATVHPKNTPSLRTFTKEGWVIVRLKKKYGGKWRCILQYSPKAKQNDLRDSTFLPHTDIERIQALISNGYLGVEALKNGTIHFVRQQNPHLLTEQNHYIA